MALHNVGRYLVAYWLVLVALFSWLVHDTLHKTVNYLSAASDLTEGYKLGILLNTIFVIFVLAGKIGQVVLFGELRTIEVEHIAERLPLFTVNLLFNLSNNDNVIFNCILLAGTVMLKIFHIILVDRMDVVLLRITNAADLEGYTGRQVLWAFAASAYFWLLPAYVAGDFLVAKFLAYDVFQGVNLVVCLLFGFQFAVQGVDLLAYFAKLLLSVYEMAVYRASSDEDDDDVDQVWETKAYFAKAIDIACSVLKALAHLTFFYLLTFNSGIPLLMLQGTFLTLKQTHSEIMLLLLFIESSKRLDQQLPNASNEDLEASDSLCIICRDDMVSPENFEATHAKKLPARRCPKKLHCGHILHMGCLKDWLERSDNCPLCRRNAFSEAPDPVLTEIPAPGAQIPEQVEPHDGDIFNSLNLPAGPPIPTPMARIYDHNTLPDNLTINLPSFALVPPNWAVLPLHRGPIPGQYGVDLSRTHQAQMRVVKPTGGNIEVYTYAPETNEHI